jgi:hypothetical protein
LLKAVHGLKLRVMTRGLGVCSVLKAKRSKNNLPRGSGEMKWTLVYDMILYWAREGVRALRIEAIQQMNITIPGVWA